MDHWTNVVGLVAYNSGREWVKMLISRQATAKVHHSSKCGPSPTTRNWGKQIAFAEEIPDASHLENKFVGERRNQPLISKITRSSGSFADCSNNQERNMMSWQGKEKKNCKKILQLLTVKLGKEIHWSRSRGKKGEDPQRTPPLPSPKGGGRLEVKVPRNRQLFYSRNEIFPKKFKSIQKNSFPAGLEYRREGLNTLSLYPLGERAGGSKITEMGGKIRWLGYKRPYRIC